MEWCSGGVEWSEERWNNGWSGGAEEWSERKSDSGGEEDSGVV